MNDSFVASSETASEANQYEGKLLVEILGPGGSNRTVMLDDPRVEYCRVFNESIGHQGFRATPVNLPSRQSA